MVLPTQEPQLTHVLDGSSLLCFTFLETLSKKHLEVCFHGDTKSRQVDMKMNDYMITWHFHYLLTLRDWVYQPAKGTRKT